MPEIHQETSTCHTHLYRVPGCPFNVSASVRYLLRYAMEYHTVVKIHLVISDEIW